ncbi:MAG: hypothetical protein J7K15_01940 [Deltaproteobacteria bacterium]|nr:hypothetical protein [Deltaproteobacteria bacterium]
MQWVVLMIRTNAYLPRVPGEKVLLNVLAVNVEADSTLEAHQKAVELAGEGWCTISIEEYDPEVHDNLWAVELEGAVRDGRA